MFKVTNKADEEEEEIIIYEEVGETTDWWSGEKHGVSAENFKAALDKVSPKPVALHIDSPGGDVYQAFAMCSAIQRYPGKVTAYIDGLAASAASYIAVVCDKVVMNDYSYLMIHCASSWARGNARDLEDIAARLRNIDANLAAIYEKRSNLSVEQVLDYMANETWFTAAEAHECGLCTEVVETEERLAACIDPSVASTFRHVPSDIRIRNADEARGKSHAPHTVTPEAVKEAACVVFDGRIFRKEGQDEL